MLVLSRNKQESIRINGNIVVTILGVQGSKVRIGIEAPQEVPILRTELKLKILNLAREPILADSTSDSPIRIKKKA